LFLAPPTQWDNGSSILLRDTHNIHTYVSWKPFLKGPSKSTSKNANPTVRENAKMDERCLLLFMQPGVYPCSWQGWVLWTVSSVVLLSWMCNVTHTGVWTWCSSSCPAADPWKCRLDQQFRSAVQHIASSRSPPFNLLLPLPVSQPRPFSNTANG
jgi:hypothetical protein